MNYDILVPIFQPAWSTRAVLESVCHCYAPRRMHLVAPAATAQQLQQSIDESGWKVGPIEIHAEEGFFSRSFGLTKDDLAHTLTLGTAHYPAGWFFQQLIKLGGHDGIEGLSDDYLVWDSDLLPVDAWPVVNDAGKQSIALLQHRDHVPASNHNRWSAWTREVLGVQPLVDPVATLVTHHGWFHRESLSGFHQKVVSYVAALDTKNTGLAWPSAMMRTAASHGSFSEFLAYSAWLADVEPGRVSYHSYEQYGSTAERFFDDGTGLFSTALRNDLGLDPEAALSPSWTQVRSFIDAVYQNTPLPSSLGFEQDRRHLEKPSANVHLEEIRSRWNPPRDGTL